VIADSADPNGITRYCDPAYMETHARMTRATMFRRLGELEELGLLRRAKFYSERGAPIYEICLNLDATIDIPIKRRNLAADGPDDEGPAHGGDEDTDAMEAATPAPESQAETLVGETKVSPSAAPKSHSCDYISPPVSKNLPQPPPGAVHSKIEAEQSEKRTTLWDRFVRGYPGIAAMDQQAAREELDALSIEDAEWAVSVTGALKDELRKARDRPPKNAHIWLRKGMFRNFPRGRLDAAPIEGVWISDQSDADRALRFIRQLAKDPTPFVRTGSDGGRGYTHKDEVSADLLAMLTFANDVVLRWTGYPRGSPEFAAWQTRFTAWIGRGLPTEPGSDCIRVPCRWPPKKDGTIYSETSEGNAA
jgi:hypothetical protein